MEVVAENKHAVLGLPIVDASESIVPESTHENIEIHEGSQKDGTTEDPKVQHGNISADSFETSSRSEEAERRKNDDIGDYEMEKTSDDMFTVTVTPPNGNNGNQKPKVATLNETFATTVDSPPFQRPELHGSDDLAIDETDLRDKGQPEMGKTFNDQQEVNSDDPMGDEMQRETQVTSTDQTVTNDGTQQPKHKEAFDAKRLSVESVETKAQQTKTEMSSYAKPTVDDVEPMENQAWISKRREVSCTTAANNIESMDVNTQESETEMAFDADAVANNFDFVDMDARHSETELASDAKPVANIGDSTGVDAQQQEAQTPAVKDFGRTFGDQPVANNSIESLDSDAQLPEEISGDWFVVASLGSLDNGKHREEAAAMSLPQTMTSYAELVDETPHRTGHEEAPDGQIAVANNECTDNGAGNTSAATATDDQSMPMTTDTESQDNKVSTQSVVPGGGPLNEQVDVVEETHTDAEPSSVESVEVIELLESDDEDSTASDDTDELIQNSHGQGPPVAKRQRTEGPPLSAGAASYQHSVAQKPNPAMQNQLAPLQQQPQLLAAFREPIYLDPVPGFVPTWKHMMPTKRSPSEPKKWKRYQLSLLSVSEFTITGMRVGDEYHGYMTSIAGLRSHIKRCSKPHGNAYYERNPDGPGKWHIPLGAYHAFYGFLKSDPMCVVDGISEAQLKIASLGKARLEKDYPSARKLVKFGVPKQLADALAPFQRGGVDFVVEKEGRVLIADEMGLGKTIQGIASMAVYHEDWPILVLCPSSARYHWENEFRHWLGKDSSINNSEHAGAFDAEMKDNESEGEAEDEEEYEPRPAMPLLDNSQIHVLTSGQNAIFPHDSTKVVICSYGLAPNLVANAKIVPGMFKCAIVDESHMLKNKSTQRTSKLLPVLRATTRCVLLSGTPAFARPMELWPQLLILGTERHGWWQEEKEFIRKYANGGTQRRAELHAMLMGTVMIRRMKNDILKTLPAKVREQGIVDVMDESTRREMQECMVTLRTGKGKLCELARGHTAIEEQTESPAVPDDLNQGQQVATTPLNMAQSRTVEMAAAKVTAASDQLRQMIDQRRAQGVATIRHTVATTQYQMDPVMMRSFVQQMENRLEDELRAFYREQLHRITAEIAAGSAAPLPNATPQNESTFAKKAVLNHMYSLTGTSKIPFVAKMLEQWLKDPTKGKLCIFAHHINVLDEIAQLAGLSNAADSTTKYIRIDGSTTPRARQEQINLFQRDPSVRIAVLGITAAGVAVTLTASSTVWFAELFWTPAIMIQAEDRCHRIGQQAHVRCLYFVAKGTLDELLWKLLENKFEALGEFVDGKEKLKMVVSKTYHSTHELLKTVTVENLADFEGRDPFSDINSECSLVDIDEIGSDIEHEIEELGLTEQKLLDEEAENEGSDPESQTESGSKPAAKQSKNDTLGRTEDEAICLSDDDNDVEVVPVGQAATQWEESSTGDVAAPSEEVDARRLPLFDLNRTFPRLRHYTLLFGGANYGIQFSLTAGRLVVSGRDEGREREFGPQAKPHVGDVLVAVNDQLIPIVPEMRSVLNVLSDAKAKGPTELVFAEDSEIASYVKERFESEAVASAVKAAQQSFQNNAAQPMSHHAPNLQRAAPTSDKVIEID